MAFLRKVLLIPPVASEGNLLEKDRNGDGHDMEKESDLKKSKSDEMREIDKKVKSMNEELYMSKGVNL